MPSRPLVECGVAAPDQMVEPPTLAGRRLVGQAGVRYTVSVPYTTPTYDSAQMC